MPTREDHTRAFLTLRARLDAAIDAAAFARGALLDAASESALEGHLDALLERHADLHGVGLDENNSTSAVFTSAVHGEAWVASEHVTEAERARVVTDDHRGSLHARASLHHKRALALMAACRRGVGLRVPRGMPLIDAPRGVHIAPADARVERLLAYEREPCFGFRDGVVAVVRDRRIAALHALGAAVTVLFLRGEELYDAVAESARDELEASLDARLAFARTPEGQGVGERFAAHHRRMLLHQNHVLRHLARRTADAHPHAHAAVQATLYEHRALLIDAIHAARVTGAEPSSEAAVFASVLDEERAFVEEASRWVTHAREDDAAGFRRHFEALAVPSALASAPRQAH